MLLESLSIQFLCQQSVDFVFMFCLGLSLCLMVDEICYWICSVLPHFETQWHCDSEQIAVYGLDNQ